MSYSTYTEGDYDTIWKHYAYQTGLGPEWFYKVQLSNLLVMPYPRCKLHILYAAFCDRVGLMTSCWSVQDFGKPNCSRFASPRREDTVAVVQDAWVHQHAGKGGLWPKEVYVSAQTVNTAGLACTGMVRTDLP